MEKKEATNISEEMETVLNEVTGKEKLVTIKQHKSYPLAGNIASARNYLRVISCNIDKTIKNFKWYDEYDQVIEWMISPNGKGLLLSGFSGTLKTTIATKVLPTLYFMKYRWKIKPILSYEIMEHWENIKHSPVVIIDDVGEEPPVSDFGTKFEAFSRVADYCEKNGKVLVITTNLNSVEMTHRYGERTADRLDLLCRPVRIEKKSLRK